MNIKYFDVLIIAFVLSLVSVFVLNSFPTALVCISILSAKTWLEFVNKTNESKQKTLALKEEEQIQSQIAEIKSKVDSLILNQSFKR